MSTLFTAARLPFSVAVGTAVGGAVSGALTPGVQKLINDANSQYPFKPPNYALMPAGVAKGRIPLAWAHARAREQGVEEGAFDQLVAGAQIGPGIATAYELWRRKLITDAEFDNAVKEEAIAEEWTPRLRGLHDRLLTPAQLAEARQQEFIDDGRLHGEGELQGYTNERMDLMFKMAGLPPGAMDGLTMLRRGIIDEQTYRELVAEGHTKTKYTDALLGLRTQILSPEVWAGLRLRGWKTAQESYAGGADSGYTPEMMDNLYLNRGRPAAPGQMYTAATRGIDGPDGRPMDLEQFMKGIQESDIRPEWGEMLWGIRFLYPSLFQLNRLVTGGAIDVPTAVDWATKARYAPEVVDALEAFWSQSAGPTAAKWADRARGRLFTVAHNEFVSAGITEAQARTALAQTGVPTGERDTVIQLWKDERAISRLELTTAEIRREYRKNIISETEALTELQDKGMILEDARKYLAQSGTATPAP